MSILIINESFNEPKISKKEILRYLGCNNEVAKVNELLDLCLKEALPKLKYKVSYCELSVSVDGDICDFDVFSVRSNALSDRLKGCKKVILFAATVGIDLDRLIAKYVKISPSKAVIFQAIGAERIEALCNQFCYDLSEKNKLKLMPRFSPGYSDLSVTVQKDIFSILNCNKNLGLYLTDGLLMSPTKSVTAFVGIVD